MRILLISHTCQSATEGQPKAEHLGRIPGVDLCVLVPDRWKHYGTWRSPQMQREGAEYRLQVGKVRAPWAGPAQFYLHWYPEMASLIKSFRPDIIDLWEEPWGLVSAQACRLRDRLSPRTLILSESEQNIKKRLPPPFEQIRSYTLSRADWVIGRSEEAVQVMRSKGYAGPSTVVPNAVDTNLFKPLSKAACRRRLGWTESTEFVVGFFGRMVPEKGIDDLLGMLELCPGTVSIAFAGNGPMLLDLKSAVQARGLASRVRFLGHVDPDQLPVVMNAVDVVAVPSRSMPNWKEQFGRVIIEAQACSVPVIGSSSGAIPNVVGNGGLLVPEQSPAELAKAVLTLQSDPELAHELGAKGLAQVHSKYTWEMVAQKMARTYEEMLGRQLPKAALAHELQAGGNLALIAAQLDTDAPRQIQTASA